MKWWHKRKVSWKVEIRTRHYQRGMGWELPAAPLLTNVKTALSQVYRGQWAPFAALWWDGILLSATLPEDCIHYTFTMGWKQLCFLEGQLLQTHPIPKTHKNWRMPSKQSREIQCHSSSVWALQTPLWKIVSFCTFSGIDQNSKI